MSVYIKGFPLPNNCGACPLRLAWCRERIYMVTRPERCPLVPVPEHGRLIDVDALERRIREEGLNQAEFYADRYNPVVMAYADCLGKVKSSPTIIPKEEKQ